MFTGLIEDVGKVLKIARGGAAARLEVASSFPDGEMRLGDSVSVNGVCLTVVEIGTSMLAFDVSPETFDRTAFRRLKPGQHVNLERALKLGDRLGGHIVSGHVDCVASIVSRREISGNYVYEFRMPKEFLRYVVEKGSVAIDGISLTVNSVSEEGFSVNIIPHTARMTNLQYGKPGAEVNIETDILGKYVERLLAGQASHMKSGVTMDLLARNGFL
ncbi:MAG TPA: riboflavin synthase [Geobacteraceae bacterium]|nr:riboflavin synthase [Geobacteraceae bacterium]